MDAQDEYSLVCGVGEHEFQIYFNRAMDVSVAPVELWVTSIQPASGVGGRHVGADSTVYTVTHEVGIGAADGFLGFACRMRWTTKGWTIPVRTAASTCSCNRRLCVDRVLCHTRRGK